MRVHDSLITVTGRMCGMATTKQRATVQGGAVRSVLVAGAGFSSAQDIHAALRLQGKPVGLSSTGTCSHWSSRVSPTSSSPPMARRPTATAARQPLPITTIWCAVSAATPKRSRLGP